MASALSGCCEVMASSAKRLRCRLAVVEEEPIDAPEIRHDHDGRAPRRRAQPRSRACPDRPEHRAAEHHDHEQPERAASQRGRRSRPARAACSWEAKSVGRRSPARRPRRAARAPPSTPSGIGARAATLPAGAAGRRRTRRRPRPAAPPGRRPCRAPGPSSSSASPRTRDGRTACGRRDATSRKRIAIAPSAFTSRAGAAVAEAEHGQDHDDRPRDTRCAA